MKKSAALLLAALLALLCACGKAGASWQEQYDLGVRYLSEGNYQEAILAFNAAIEIDPNQAGAYVGRGDAYVLSGETAENLAAALADYEQAIALDETDPAAYLGLADVYIRQGDYDRAMEILRQGLEKTGSDQSIADKLAEIEAGNITDSSGRVRRMTRYGPDGAVVFWHDFTYDSQGRQSSVTSYSGSGEQTGYVALTYDENGNTLDSYGWMDDTGEVIRISAEYNAQGQMIRETHYLPAGVTYRDYQYDAQGNQVRVDQFGADGELNYYELWEHNSRGEPVKRSIYAPDGQLNWYETYEYDEAGRRVGSSSYQADGTLDWYEVYRYDAEGTMIARESYDGNGNLMGSTQYG